MWRMLGLAAVLAATATALAGRTIRVSSSHFSFTISEPEDWMIDFQSAAQVAHFVISPRGLDWRASDTVIFGRFVEIGEKEGLDEFVSEDEARFQTQCPAAIIARQDLELRAAHDFHIVSYRCPGTQSDLVAVAQVPGRFAVFILSAQRGGPFEPGLVAFREVLESFRWIEKEPAANLPR